MPKATPKTTTPRRAPPVTAVAAPAAPKHDKAARRDGMMQIFSADWTDALWDSRNAVGKMGCVADGVGERLAGLAAFCYSLAWADLTKSGRKDPDEPMPPGYDEHRYLAQALGGLSKALKAARAAWWETVRTEEAAQEQRRELPRQRRDAA
jgi:hypothetical protein